MSDRPWSRIRVHTDALALFERDLPEGLRIDFRLAIDKLSQEVEREVRDAVAATFEYVRLDYRLDQKRGDQQTPRDD